MLRILDYKTSKFIGSIPMAYDAATLDKLRGEIRARYDCRYALIWETPK